MAKTQADQDTYDKAFIKVIHALQKIGFCKNIAELERHLDMPKRSLNQVLYGHRGVAKTHRHKLLQFFTDNYRVNARVFVNNMTPIFEDQPPTLEEQPEKYFAKKESQKKWTMGDMVELERLRREAADKDEKIKDLKKELKQCRDLTQYLMGEKKGNEASGSKTGHKTGQKKKG